MALNVREEAAIPEVVDKSRVVRDMADKVTTVAEKEFLSGNSTPFDDVLKELILAIEDRLSAIEAKLPK